MKVTALEEYGLRCLLDLARHAEEPRPVTVRDVAAREGLSVAYTEKLLRVLSQAGLAEVSRGSKGGFRLKGTPSTVTVGDAMRALGGFSSQHEICTRYTGEQPSCVHLRSCTVRPIWGFVNRQISALLDAIPLQWLLSNEHDARRRMHELIPVHPSQRQGGLP